MFGITDENRQEVLGLLLITFGLLLGLSLMPPQWIEGIFAGVVGSANLAGPVGEYLGNRLVSSLGWGAALAPFIVVAWGIDRFLERSPVLPIRLTVLAFFIPLLYSAAGFIRTNNPADTGWLAGDLSRWLVDQIGMLGSLLVIYATGLLVILLATGIRIGPLTSILLGWLGMAFNKGGTAVRRLLVALEDWRMERKRRRREETETRVKERLGHRRASAAGTKRKIEGGGGGRSVRVVRGGGRLQDAPCIEEREDGSRPVDMAGGYNLPPLSLLTSPKREPAARADKENGDLARILIDTLGDFNIRAEVVDIVSGPVITMFELKPAPGIKVSQVQSLSDDLAMAMKAYKIRVVAPIPGKGAVGIEIPNSRPEKVFIREILGDESFLKSGSTLPLPLGKDIVGKPVVADLTGMPHLLIAGATGSGKSVNIHCLVTGFLYHFSPDDLTLIMIDPKMLELGIYNGIPHLLVPVVTDPKEAVKALRWAVREMEERYSLLAAKGVRSIPEYNRRVSAEEGGAEKRLPFLVIIIDELADLILTMQNDVEDPLTRLAQMARGVGIHLILATQRPSVDVITGLIKANFPSRISFRVATKTDSRTILDTNGAEKLLGKGDMLYMPGGSSTPIRIHGAFISQPELERVVDYVRSQVGVWQPEGGGETAVGPLRMGDDKDPCSEDQDELFNQAARLVVLYGHGSTSLLQRKLKIGYTRAARIVDQLEEASIVGPPNGSKARQVLVDESYLKDKGIE